MWKSNCFEEEDLSEKNHEVDSVLEWKVAKEEEKEVDGGVTFLHYCHRHIARITIIIVHHRYQHDNNH